MMPPELAEKIRREAEEAGKLREQARAEARAVRKGDGEGSQPAEPDGPVARGGQSA